MTDWVRVADAGAIVHGEAFASEYNGIAIALYRYEDEIYAIGDICTHEHVRLSEGWLEGDRIECPLHQSCFDIRTGKAIQGGLAYDDVAAFDVRVDDGSVFVRARS